MDTRCAAANPSKAPGSSHHLALQAKVEKQLVRCSHKVATLTKLYEFRVFLFIYIYNYNE